LRAYQQRLLEIRARGAQLVAISPQRPDQSLSMAEKNALEFEVLSDAGNRVARQFGLVFPLAARLRQVYKNVGGIDLSVYNGDESWELPMPGTFVIGRDRTIQLAYVEADYTRRLEPGEILDCLQQLG
jgi:peroxiredoxin